MAHMAAAASYMAHLGITIVSLNACLIYDTCAAVKTHALTCYVLHEFGTFCLQSYSSQEDVFSAVSVFKDLVNCSAEALDLHPHLCHLISDDLVCIPE